MVHNHVCFVNVEEDVVLTSKPNAFDTIYAEVLQECKTYDASRWKRLSRQQLTRISQNRLDDWTPKTMTAETPNFWIIGINIETVAQTIRIT